MFLCPTNRLWLFSIAIIIHIGRWYVQFLSNLRKHHSAVSYLNFVLHSERESGERFSRFVGDNEKFLFRRSNNFGSV